MSAWAMLCHDFFFFFFRKRMHSFFYCNYYRLSIDFTIAAERFYKNKILGNRKVGFLLGLLLFDLCWLTGIREFIRYEHIIFCLDIYNVKSGYHRASTAATSSQLIALRKQHCLQHQTQNNITLHMQNPRSQLQVSFDLPELKEV